MRNLLIFMVANFLFSWTKQIFYLVIKLEPQLLSWVQPRKNNCVPTELDVSTSAMDLATSSAGSVINISRKDQISNIFNGL